MITAQDMAQDMAFAPASPARSAATPFRERTLLVVLFLTVLASSVAFIEPSPHDGLMGILAIACLVSGIRFERKAAPLVLLLLTLNFAGILSLLNRPAEPNDIQYVAISIYLAIATIMFACLFAENTMQRMGVMRAAYVLTATVISLAGIAGYFHLFPGAYDLFAPGGRALGGFKDPNVFGPFLIWPTLVVLERMVARRISALDIVVVSVLLLGLLFSFSRGAWFHFAVSGAVMIALAFVTAPTAGSRMRIFGLSVIVVLSLAAIFAILLTFDSIGAMFRERAQIQSYDVSDGGRFQMQEFALAAVFEFPNGMGPYGFSVAHGLQQHNVYLQAFMAYGWLGGVTYFILLAVTLWIGMSSVLIRTPWQPYLVTALAAFVGELAEGFIIDSDHWRHFFLLLGIIWGLAIATSTHMRRNSPAMRYAPR